MDPGAISTSISLIQKVIKLGKKATNLQYEEALLAAREAIFDLREQNIALKEENRRLNEVAARKDKTDFDSQAGVYWLKNDTEKQRPICPRCMEKEGVLISLNVKSSGLPDCPECKSYFNPYDE